MNYVSGLWLFVLAAILIYFLLIYCYQYRKSEIGAAFCLLMVCAFIWVFFFIFENAASDLNTKLIFAKLEFLGIAFLPLAWLNLVLTFTGHPLKTRSRTLLGLIPLLTVLVCWTNPWHHWFIGAPRLILDGAPFEVVDFDYQFWFYYIHAPYSYAFLLTAIVFLVTSLGKMEQVYRDQGKLLLLAIVLPSLTDILYVAGYSPIPNYNITTAMFSISGVLIAMALFSFRFLDLLPLARGVVIDNLNDGVLVLDQKNRLVEVNPAAQRILGIQADLIGNPLLELENASLQPIIHNFNMVTSQVDIEIGTDKHYDLRIVEVKNKKKLVLGWVITLRDITERIHLLKQLHDMAIKDSLTGVYNRRYFLELAQREIYRLHRYAGYQFSVVMMDLDDFKTINDLYGHFTGDQVLKTFCQCFQSELRTVDIFGRLGGDEFALLLVDITPLETRNTLDRINRMVASMRIPISTDALSISLSYGMVSSSQVGMGQQNIMQMLRMADQALYHAKLMGRNRIEEWSQLLQEETNTIIEQD